MRGTRSISTQVQENSHTQADVLRSSNQASGFCVAWHPALRQVPAPVDLTQLLVRSLAAHALICMQTCIPVLLFNLSLPQPILLSWPKLRAVGPTVPGPTSSSPWDGAEWQTQNQDANNQLLSCLTRSKPGLLGEERRGPVGTGLPRSEWSPSLHVSFQAQLVQPNMTVATTCPWMSLESTGDGGKL